MKIALLTGTFSQFSGIDRVVAQQANTLQTEGHEVTVLCLEGEMKSTRYKVIELGMPKSVFWQRIYRLLVFPLDWKKMHTVMGEIGKQDIVYSHQYPLNALAMEMQRKWGTRYVYYNHGIPPPSAFLSFFEKIYIQLFRWFANRSIAHADEVISISRFLAEVCKKETGRVSRVVHDTVDPERFQGAVSGEEIRQRFEVGTAPLLLSVGRISPHKGLHLLLSAFHKVREHLPAAKLLIVGKPTFEKYFVQLQRHAGPHVYFVGFVSDADLPKFYAASDVYVTASQWEGFNLPFAEAQALQKPVVAFAVGPHSEVFQGKGRLVPPGDVEAFAQAILRCLKKEESI